MEEIGELAKAINMPKLRNKKLDQQNLNEEFADVFLLLSNLAKTHNVDLESAVKIKIEKLKKELSYLEKEKRKEVANQLKFAASFGDLSENSAYDDAKNEQNILEIKISNIFKILDFEVFISNFNNFFHILTSILCYPCITTYAICFSYCT